MLWFLAMPRGMRANEARLNRLPAYLLTRLTAYPVHVRKRFEIVFQVAQYIYTHSFHWMSGWKIVLIGYCFQKIKNETGKLNLSFLVFGIKKHTPTHTAVYRINA